MNEKLEKQVQEWISSHVKAPKDSIYAPPVIEWGESIAKHFYKLALQDVKEKCKTEYTEYEKLNHPINNAICGRLGGYADIMSFIDTINK